MKISRAAFELQRSALWRWLAGEISSKEEEERKTRKQKVPGNWQGFAVRVVNSLRIAMAEEEAETAAEPVAEAATATAAAALHQGHAAH